MIAVITGDIINSRAVEDQRVWINPLKAYLAQLGPTPAKWEIFRGDNFQLELASPSDALEVAFHIKSIVKTSRELDVRMAIGIGQKSHDAQRISESNGSAYIRSGEAFEYIKKTSSIFISSEWGEFDEAINLYLRLANVIMSGWKPATAEIVTSCFSNPGLSQKELGELIGMTQPSVSAALSRASYHELSELIVFYRKKLDLQQAI